MPTSSFDVCKIHAAGASEVKNTPIIGKCASKSKAKNCPTLDDEDIRDVGPIWVIGMSRRLNRLNRAVIHYLDLTDCYLL